MIGNAKQNYTSTYDQPNTQVNLSPMKQDFSNDVFAPTNYI